MTAGPRDQTGGAETKLVSQCPSAEGQKTGGPQVALTSHEKSVKLQFPQGWEDAVPADWEKESLVIQQKPAPAEAFWGCHSELPKLEVKYSIRTATPMSVHFSRKTRFYYLLSTYSVQGTFLFLFLLNLTGHPP